MKVADASVIAKCYLPEEDSDKAEALYRQIRPLYAPFIIRVEVASAITRRVRTGAMDAADANRQCRLWFDHLDNEALILLPQVSILDRAVELSTSLRHPLADCLYLAAGELTELPLITADAVFYQKAQSAHAIELLKHYIPHV